ncbi:hypothetical protein [Georgenia sp. SYP-B2076]|uniref:hypothetical protein n=1 Tax=Georgenia sp. SYP-B2076 TaxID=2495881 RepID=UPI001F0C64D8|nr:hypothetical protein [Georgenia sp. SYP-B2076]
MHTRLALEAGETAQRLAVLSAWRDTALFSEGRDGGAAGGGGGDVPAGGGDPAPRSSPGHVSP